MKYRNKIGAILLSICLLLPMFSIVSYAASGSVSVSSKSGNVGSTVTITCTIKCSSGPIGYADVTLVYDPAALQWVSGTNMAQGGSGSVHYVGTTQDGTSSSLSFSMTFKILKDGSHKVSTSTASASDIDEVQFAPSKGSGTITGKVKTTTTTPTTPSTGNNSTGNNDTPTTTKDTNCKLSSLQVYPGTLSPAFSADTTSYTVTVPSDTTEVTISATPQSSKATVTVSGGKDLKLGANEARVIVVAESGASVAYTITIMCGEEEKIQIGGKDNTINEAFTDEQIPTGFTRTKVTYNGRQYEAVTNANSNLVLMSLQAGDTNNFYIYNQETQEFHTFVQITIAEGKYIIPLPLSEDVVEFADYDTVTLQVQEKSFDAWKLDEEFSVAYVMNQDGVETLYRYDSVDGTFQRYTDIKVEDVEQTPIQKTWFPNEYYMYAIVGLGVFAVVLLIAMIYFIASRKARHEGRKRKAIKRQEKQRAKEEKQREKEERELEKQRQIVEKEREKQRQIEEKELEKQRAKEEKQRAKEEKKLAKQKKKEK